jgi:ubiquinone/menaquinone biosynthesis C-methylase UbiE
MTAVDRVNLAAYSDPELVRIYTDWDWLQPAEQAILTEVGERIRDSSILDIGVGGGRTVAPLRSLSTSYVGIDYCPAMVEACRQRTPDAKILLCDARAMSIFPENAFQFVLFSFNGLDSVSHADRLIVLREVFRVLSPGGWFAFSSHNARSSTFARYRSPLRALAYRPMQQHIRGLASVPERLRSLRAHWRNRRHEEWTPDYAVVNEPTALHSYLLYYCSMEVVIEQLRVSGFAGPVRCYDKDGAPSAPDSRSSWIYYLATK